MTGAAARSVREAALPLRTGADLDPVLERIGSARYVLIGEASHGTHEFYAWRAALTRRLVEERGFTAVGVEGDWPDCWAVHRSTSLDPAAPDDPRDALLGFDRWPTWLWANRDVVDFARWLREHNAARPPAERTGFYGLDVYSLWDSLRAALDYLREHEPQHVDTALEALHCFDPYAEDPHSYARATGLVPSGCESEVTRLLQDLLTGRAAPGGTSPGERFNAEQNAWSAAGAEAYYRAVVRGGPQSWNVRDEHMTDTLDRVADHHGPGAKVVVWEHNTHVGDARFTDMARAGMVNVGQLVRERHRDEGVVLVGFGSHRGTVVAADRWGGRTEVMPLPPAREGSVEHLLHTALGPGASALFVFGDELPGWADEHRDHRAVGVVYRPQAERWGNYVPTVLGRRYDVFCWLDETRALDPLHGTREHGGERETWPSGT